MESLALLENQFEWGEDILVAAMVLTLMGNLAVVASPPLKRIVSLLFMGLSMLFIVVVIVLAASGNAPPVKRTAVMVLLGVVISNMFFSGLAFFRTS